MTPQSDEDEVWRQIIASYNDPAENPPAAERPWPEREDVSAAEPGPPDDSRDSPPDSEGGESGQAYNPDDDHYEPPPPPPLPKLDGAAKLAWLALFGGPAYLLFAAVLGWPMDGWIVFAAVGAFIGGFVALVVRMGDSPPTDSGWDDGAVI